MGNVENEKARDAEIQSLIAETRENLQREYGEYNAFCDEKVEGIKSECLKFRDGVVAETKQSLHDKESNFETAKDLMRARYEEEIANLRKLHENKAQRAQNDLDALHRHCADAKHKMETELCEERELCGRAFERKIAEKEKQIAERIKVISMRYELKMESAAKRRENEHRTRAVCDVAGAVTERD